MVSWSALAPPLHSVLGFVDPRTNNRSSGTVFLRYEIENRLRAVYIFQQLLELSFENVQMIAPSVRTLASLDPVKALPS